MNKSLLRMGVCGLTCLLALASCDRANGLADGNAVIAQCAGDDQTSVAKEQCEKDNLNRSFAFSGTVENVRSSAHLIVKIDQGNYANVYLSAGNDGSKLTKGSAVRFEGKLTDVGTGIMIYHDISDAKLR